MKHGKKIKKVLCIALTTVLVVFVITLMYDMTKRILGLDFSQSYRKIKGIENIVFRQNWGKKLYKRHFWGLGQAGKTIKFSEHNKLEQIGELMYYIDSENDIAQAIGSPDGRYILYCEIVHNYYKTDMSDDEYCYYRVYDIETGTIVTIYAGYRQWFDLDWQ